MVALEIIVVVLLVLLNGFLAMAELAIVSSRRSRLEQLAAKGHSGARAALDDLADDPGRFLATVQAGLTLIGVLAGAFSGITLAQKLDAWLDLYPALAPYSKPVAVAVVVVAVTYFSLVMGELVPKQIALKDPEAIAMRVAAPVAAFTLIAAPLVRLLNLSTVPVLRFLGLRPGFQRHVTDKDIIGVLIEGEKAGLIHAAERDDRGRAGPERPGGAGDHDAAARYCLD